MPLLDLDGQIEDTLRQLLQTRQREEELEDEISTLVQASVDLPQRMRSSLEHVNEDVSLAKSDLRQLSNGIALSCSLADGICSKVRKLDVAKARIVECLQLVEDVLDLRVCAQGVRTAMLNEDYEQAAAHVHRFLTLDEVVLEASSYVTNDEHTTPAQDMNAAADQLKTIVTRQFDQAVQSNDMPSAQRFFKLFPALLQQEDGVCKFGAFLKSTIVSEKYQSAIGDECNSSRANVLYADALTLLLEGVARVIELQQPIVDAYYGAEHRLALWSIVQEQCDAEASNIFHAFRQSRKLNRLVDLVHAQKGDNRVDPLELDILLTEMTLMHTRVEMYFQFLRRRVGAGVEALADNKDDEKAIKQRTRERFTALLRECRLSRGVQELLGAYISLEEYYMRESVRKAVRLEYRDEGSTCSSLPDDVFFIIRKSVRRALSSSNVDCVCAMLNYACALLESDYTSELKTRLKSSNLLYSGFADAYCTAAAAYASVVQQGKLTSATGDGAESQVDDYVVALNNCQASAQCIEHLVAGLTGDFQTAFGDKLTERDRAKLTSRLSQFEDVQQRCVSIAGEAVTIFVRHCMRAKLKVAVDTFFDDTHSPNEVEFAQVDARNSFVETLVSTLSTLSQVYKAKMVDATHAQVMNELAGETASQVERAVMKGTYNRLGGILLDKQVRELSTFWTSLCGWSAREKFSRLNQISCLLNVDSVNEAKDFCQSDHVVWRLSSSEVRQVLALRIDLPGSDIRTICT